MEEQQKKLQLKRMTRICSKDATQNKNMSQEAVLRNRCYMSGCKNNRICRDKQTTMPMFLFPLDLNLAKFWLGICNHQPYDCPFHGQTVCKDHFQIENLAAGSDTNGIALKPNVIPTAKIPNICYSMILEYLKQRKEGKTLDPKHIGVDFTCSKANCTFARASPSKATTLKCYANPKKASTSKDGSNGGVRITLKRRNADGTEEVQPGPKIFITAKSKPPESEEPSKSTTQCINPNRPCKITQRKIVQIPIEIQNRISQVMKHMTQIIQDFMAFQIHITHLKQAVVCANEKISNSLTKTLEVEPQLYKKFHALNNFLLLLYEIHGTRSSDVISFCTKIWRRIVDCHQELKTGGKLKTFITAANGCLVTIVKAIDAISLLKSLWKSLQLKIDERDMDVDEDWTNLDKTINEHIEDATEKLEAIDVEVHMTRQKILEIKKPSIRIMEVSQMDVDLDMIYISSVQSPEKKGTEEKLKSSTVRILKKPVRRESTLELGEIVENEVEKSVVIPSNPAVTVVQPEISSMPVLSNTFQQTPSLAYPTMPTMQAQLIPTIQLDAFGNQSVVYQLAYQQVTPQIPQGLTVTQNQGFVLPGYNTQQFQVPNHQVSPTIVSQDMTPTHYGMIMEKNPADDQVIVVKPETDEEDVKIKEEPPEETPLCEQEEQVTMLEEDEQPYIKNEPEWNEDLENSQ